MPESAQKQKAQIFLKLHHAQQPLVLANIWNPLGARILEHKGFPAVATASAAISASLGYKDGERIRFSTLIDIASRIANSVDIPTSIDIESGYSETDTGLIRIINEVLDAGIVGINIEDSIDDQLRNTEHQARRIAIIRDIADQRGIHLVVNARIDCFMLNKNMSNSEKVVATINRAEAYIKAGADCIFPIGVSDVDTLKTLRAAINAPLNVLVLPDSLTPSTMQGMGINRYSYGPFIFRALYKQFSVITDQLHATGFAENLQGNMLSHDEIDQYLR